MGIMCKIHIDKPVSGVHRPGDKVSGVIQYALDEPTEFKDVSLSLIGDARCRWSENSTDNSSTTYIGTETLITQEFKVLEKKSYDIIKVAVGTYDYRFQFVLPSRLPSSCRSRFGYIEYKIKIAFEKASFFSFTKKLEKEIIIYGYVETSSPEGPIIFGLEKRLLTLFTNNNKVTLKVEVPKILFAPGENVQLKYEVRNNTNVMIIAVKTELLCVIEYRSNSGRVKYYRKTIGSCTVQTPPVLERSVTELNNTMNIPPDQYSIQHSEIIKKDYRLRVTVRLPFPHLNDSVDIPIVVGETGKPELAIEAITLNEECLSSEATARQEPPPTYWEAMAEEKS